MTDTQIAATFHPHHALAQVLLARLDPAGTDGSHDLSHIIRVWRNAAAIAAIERGCDLELLVAAVILHDCVAVEKDSPLRSQASRLAAARASEIMAEVGFAPERIAALAHVVAAHSFSAAIEPETLEARILQDADRLDAIGAIGIARCFYVGGRMGSGLYHPTDPRAADRAYDDVRFALDHFDVKLFKIAKGFRTPAGQAMAAVRLQTMHRFVDEFLGEIG